MAHRVTPEIIEDINHIYALCKNVKQTAEAVGFSESTVRKYLIKDYVAKPVEKIEFHIEFPSIDDTISMLLSGEPITLLKTEEKPELKKLQKGMIV